MKSADAERASSPTNRRNRSAIAGARGREMQIGDEERRVHARTRGQPTTSARSMITSSTGTSWCMPRRPVFTALILSTTSVPSVTRPKTQ